MLKMMMRTNAMIEEKPKCVCVVCTKKNQKVFVSKIGQHKTFLFLCFFCFSKEEKKRKNKPTRKNNRNTKKITKKSANQKKTSRNGKTVVCILSFFGAGAGRGMQHENEKNQFPKKKHQQPNPAYHNTK